MSFPFTPGHEVVGELDDGSRVVIVPVLSCVARGIDPVCGACADGRINHCERIGYGQLEPGLQCGFCESHGRRLVDPDAGPRVASWSPCPTS